MFYVVLVLVCLFLFFVIFVFKIVNTVFLLAVFVFVFIEWFWVGGGGGRWLVRILVMYLVWTMFYAIYGKQVINSWFIKKVMFDGIIPAFWYFPSMILSITVCVMLNKVISPFWVCILTMLMYIFALFGDTYSNVNPIACFLQRTILKYHYHIFDYTTRDGILFGCFYISLGNYFNEHKESLKRVRNYTNYKLKICTIIVICFIFEAFEIYIAKIYNLGADINVLISTIPLSALIFVFAYNVSVETKTALTVRKLSTLIWLVHPFVINILKDKVGNSVVRFVVVLTVTGFISGVFIKLSSKIGILKNLY